MVLNIDKSQWMKVQFGDVVQKVSNKIDPETYHSEIVIRGGHINKRDFHIREYENKIELGYLGPAFHMGFKKHQILYVSRNPHLMKVGYPHFDGICANTTFIMETKDESVLRNDLIPFIMHSDTFIEQSVANVRGGVNPYVNWSDLACIEFLLPPKDQQAQLAKLLWAMDEVIEREGLLCHRAQALLEAFRRKMNQGDLELYTGDQLTDLITKGASPKWQGFDYCDEGTLFVTSENVLEDSIDLKEKKFLPLAFNHKQKRSQLNKGDILINIVGASIGRLAIFNEEVENANINQAVCLFRVNSTVVPEYIVNYLLEESNKNRLLNNQSATARPNLSLKNLSDFKFFLPTKSEQEKRMEDISKIKHSLNCSKLQMKKSQSLQKSIINQVF
jgi:restriction endonuclease S subunit